MKKSTLKRCFIYVLISLVFVLSIFSYRLYQENNSLRVITSSHEFYERLGDLTSVIVFIDEKIKLTEDIVSFSNAEKQMLRLNYTSINNYYDEDELINTYFKDFLEEYDEKLRIRITALIETDSINKKDLIALNNNLGDVWQSLAEARDEQYIVNRFGRKASMKFTLENKQNILSKLDIVFSDTKIK